MVKYLITSSLGLEVFVIINYMNLSLNVHVCSDMKAFSMLRKRP